MKNYRQQRVAQLAAKFKIEVEYYYEIFVQVDSKMLQNRQLRQHANRWR
jgi:hypothetical protein